MKIVYGLAPGKQTKEYQEHGPFKKSRRNLVHAIAGKTVDDVFFQILFGSNKDECIREVDGFNGELKPNNEATFEFWKNINNAKWKWFKVVVAYGNVSDVGLLSFTLYQD